MPRDHRPTQRERGAALVMVLAVLTLLTVLGLIAMQAVTVDQNAAVAERGAEEARYISEAGLHWALQYISTNYTLDPSNPDFTPLVALPAVTASPIWGPSQIVGWHELHPAEMYRPYAGGFYRAVVKPADPPDNKTLLVRCLARTGNARRLVEVAVSPGTP
jgi:hypothetical protein